MDTGEYRLHMDQIKLEGESVDQLRSYPDDAGRLFISPKKTSCTVKRLRVPGHTVPHFCMT